MSNEHKRNEPVAKAIVPGYIIEWLGPHFGTQLPKGEHSLYSHPPAAAVNVKLYLALQSAVLRGSFACEEDENAAKAALAAAKAAKEHGL